MTSPWLFQAKKEELHIGLGIPKAIAIEIHNWAEEQEWSDDTELEPIEEYHITMLFIPTGHKHKDDDWVKHDSHAVTIKGIKAFPSKEREPKDAIVLLVDSETIRDHHKELAKEAEKAGLDVGPFAHDKFSPHLTIAYGSLPSGLKPPELTFETEVSSVSPPRIDKESAQAYPQTTITPLRAIVDKEGNIHTFIAGHAPYSESNGLNPDENLAHLVIHKGGIVEDISNGPGKYEDAVVNYLGEPYKSWGSVNPSHWNFIKGNNSPYLAALVRFADSWEPKTQWPRAMSDGDMPVGEQPSAPECSCKAGHKLDCPVHGMHPVLPDYKDTLDFPDPNNPAGYDYHSEAPRTWMRAETKKKAKRKKLWVDDTRRPPDDSWDWARNVAEAIDLTKGPPGESKAGYDHMSLDHDLGIVKYEGKVVVNPDALDGGDFVLWLHEHGDKKHMPKSVNIHSHNEHAIELMVKALEPHTKVTVKRAPDDLEEEWAREFKVHEPSEIEEESIRLPEKEIRSRTASHQLAWLPGSNLRGKGLVTPNGDVHTWPVNAEGMPHHAEYVDQRQPYQLSDGTAYFFQIRPRGGLDTKGYTVPPNIIHHVLKTVPSLRAGESTDWHFAADQFDTREYPDARMMPPTTMQEPAQSNPHPEKHGCTCEEGEKLECPVHGLHPTEQGYDHSWSIPQGHPVGYPQDQPRNYMKAEGAVPVGYRANLWHGSSEGQLGPIHPGFFATSHRPEAEGYAGMGLDLSPEDKGNIYPVTVNFKNPLHSRWMLKQEAVHKAEKNGHDGVVLHFPKDNSDPSNPLPAREWIYAIDPSTVSLGHVTSRYWNFQIDDPAEEAVSIRETPRSDGEEVWTGLPRAEGAIEDDDEHRDNLEGENVAVPKPPADIRKKRKEREDIELVREGDLLHSAA